MRLHDKIVANLLEKSFYMTEKVIMEHLCIYVEVFIIFKDFFFDPLRNIFRYGSEV